MTASRVEGRHRLREWRTAVRVHYRLVPWWAKVLVVFVVTRLVTTVILRVFAAGQGANPWTDAHPGYFDYAAIWDGRWYEVVAYSGYPVQLPVDATGHVGENAWAFLPGYPMVVNAVAFATVQPWRVAAVLVSLGFGLAAALLLHRLLSPRFGSATAMFAVVLFCVSPVSPLLQSAYAESMYLFWLILGLWLIERRRYLALVPVVVVMGFTRPSGLAFALALLAHAGWRFLRRRREPFPVRERVTAGIAGVVAVAAGVAWPAVAAAVTGRPDAYTATEMAWRASYSSDFARFIPFTPWFEGANWWLGAPLGTITVLVLVIGFALVLSMPAVLRLGDAMWPWVASYALYLFAVFFPQSSTFRILMPLVPLLGVVALGRSRIYRIALVALCIAGQCGWLWLCWRYGPPYGTPP